MTAFFLELVIGGIHQQLPGDPQGDLDLSFLSSPMGIISCTLHHAMVTGSARTFCVSCDAYHLCLKNSAWHLQLKEKLTCTTYDCYNIDGTVLYM